MTESSRRQQLRERARVINDPDNAGALDDARALRGQQAEAPIVVSACLLGAPTRYDGSDRRTDTVARAVAERAVLPLCPELLGGLGCPRAPIHFQRGDGDGLVTGDGLAIGSDSARAIDDGGIDRGTALLAGARRALALAQAAGAHEAILKERSPSCGCHEIHTANGVAGGRGVFAALAARAGIACRSEDDLGPPRSRR